MYLRKSQAGMSFIALIFVIGMIAYTVYIGLKLVPEYIEFQSVKTAVDSVATEIEQRSLNKNQAENLLRRKLDVGYVDFNSLKRPSADYELPKSKQKEVFQYKREKDKVSLALRYEKRIDLFANIQVLLGFDYTKTVAAR